jgi:hypothetical protein
MTRRISTFIGAILMVCVVALAANTFGQKPDDSNTVKANDTQAAKVNVEDETVTREQWEYLVVAGGNSNLSPSGSTSMRKEPKVQAFRENFVLAQNMDKLGAQGWELISVTGLPTDPVYYFKRRK